MNKFLSYGVFAFTVLLSSCDSQPKQEPLADVIDRGLKASTEQALLMAKDLESQEGRLPKAIGKDGKLAFQVFSHQKGLFGRCFFDGCCRFLEYKHVYLPQT